MLNEIEFLQLCQHLNLSDQARAVVEQIRAAPPTRRVQGGRGNVSVRYPSQKMGCIIQAESHKNELALIYELEYDPQVLEYYDQPPSIKLSYLAKSGRTTAFWHTPDFFVIRTDGMGWVECKPEAELSQLAEKMPHRYIGDDTGRWNCPPGERYAASYDLAYQVWSSAQINWIFQRNLRFLEDYLRHDCPVVRPTLGAEIRSLSANEPGITLDILLSRLDEASCDDCYSMIALGQLYVDLQTDPLPETERVHVFPDQATAQAYVLLPKTLTSTSTSGLRWVELTIGSNVTWDNRPWLIINMGDTRISLSAEDGAIVELPHKTFEELIKTGKVIGPSPQEQITLSEAAQAILAKASPAAKQEANRRYYEVIEPSLTGQAPLDQTTPARTLRYWRQKYRKAQAQYGYGYLGLLPQHSQKGNHTRKLPENTLKLMTQFIEDNYETVKQKNKRIVYGQLLEACQAQHIPEPSYKTFAAAIKQRDRFEQVKQRQGRRAAEQERPFYWELSQTTPRHGDRPFEIVHIDHTELDIELIHSQTGHNLGRPWATFLVDAFSRRLLAVHLTYDPPSYRSCMMILRECVRRYGRLPQVLVVDGGKEFQSIYFETLLARYEIIKKSRPAAQPRFGSVCERLFGTANTTFVHNLEGNTQIMRNVRQVSKAINPKTLAGWTLSRLHDRFSQWSYEVYDRIEHPALGQSPADAFTLGLKQGGQRLHRLIPYQAEFIMATLPTTPRGTAKVQPNLGVKLNYIYYWSDYFRQPGIEASQVPVRYDPFNAGLAYAFVKPNMLAEGQWVECIAEYYAAFAHRSEREIKLASAELRRQHQRHAQQFKISAKILANFLTSVEAEEVLSRQRWQDAEARTSQETLPKASGLSPLPTPLPPPGSTKSELDLADLELYEDF